MGEATYQPPRVRHGRSERGAQRGLPVLDRRRGQLDRAHVLPRAARRRELPGGDAARGRRQRALPLLLSPLLVQPLVLRGLPLVLLLHRLHQLRLGRRQRQPRIFQRDGGRVAGAVAAAAAATTTSSGAHQSAVIGVRMRETAAATKVLLQPVSEAVANVRCRWHFMGL